ncbi:hypothetical protein ACFVIM_28625 [Streptomyces sp. NPDC057638]|uniref:hypothetical protein n=1 Tax=Streptomyces sp. NPDC057638 TaxID=3346190 RepID=UPI0036AC59E9
MSDRIRQDHESDDGAQYLLDQLLTNPANHVLESLTQALGIGVDRFSQRTTSLRVVREEPVAGIPAPRTADNPPRPARSAPRPAVTAVAGQISRTGQASRTGQVARVVQASRAGAAASRTPAGLGGPTRPGTVPRVGPAPRAVAPPRPLNPAGPGGPGARPDVAVPRITPPRVVSVPHTHPAAAAFAHLDAVEDGLFRIYLALEDITGHYAPDDHPAVVIMKRMEAFDVDDGKAVLTAPDLSRHQVLNWFGDAVDFLTELPLRLRPLMNRMDIRENHRNNGRTSGWTARVEGGLTQAVQELRLARNASVKLIDERERGLLRPDTGRDRTA